MGRGESPRTASRLGLDMMDQNMPGFSDDNMGNDGDGDSLTKSKLNLNAAKDKKKPFFKKVVPPSCLSLWSVIRLII